MRNQMFDSIVYITLFTVLDFFFQMSPLSFLQATGLRYFPLFYILSTNSMDNCAQNEFSLNCHKLHPKFYFPDHNDYIYQQ